MASWGEFATLRPDLADAGRALLYQYGVGLGFLATVRADGGPRVHPMCPLICGDGLYAFIVPGPKLADLRRDGRYALHSFPCEDNEDGFYLTGRAPPAGDPGIRAACAAQFAAEREGMGAPPPEQELFAFAIERCLLTQTTGHGDQHPRHTVWHEA